MKLSRTLAWSIWAAAAIFYAYQYVLRIMPNIMIDDIMQNFSMNAKVFGQFSGIYYIGYALFHLPLGLALDRFGAKKIMPLCVILTIIGMLSLLFQGGAFFPIAGRLLLGIGSSAAALCAMNIVRIAFNIKHFTRLLSLIVTVGLFGAIYGGAPLTSLYIRLGFENVILLFMGIGLLLAIGAYFLIPETSHKNHSHMLHDLLSVFKNKQVMLTGFSAGLMVGPLEGFADVWGAKFLSIVYHIPFVEAKPLPSLIFVGMCFGAPLLSLIAEKTNAYVKTIASAGLIMFVCFALLLTGLFSHVAITLSFILIGICSGYQILALYQASTYTKVELAGLATTVTNMIIMVFGYFFHTLIGGIINAFGGAQNIEALLYGITIIPAALALGTIGFFMLHASSKKTNAFTTSA